MGMFRPWRTLSTVWPKRMSLDRAVAVRADDEEVDGIVLELADQAWPPGRGRGAGPPGPGSLELSSLGDDLGPGSARRRSVSRSSGLGPIDPGHRGVDDVEHGSGTVLPSRGQAQGPAEDLGSHQGPRSRAIADPARPGEGRSASAQSSSSDRAPASTAGDGLTERLDRDPGQQGRAPRRAIPYSSRPRRARTAGSGPIDPTRARGQLRPSR